MSNAESTCRHLGSLFVVSTFLNSFCGGLASNIAMTIWMANEAHGAPHYTHSADAAAPLACVLRAAQDICLGMQVGDRDSVAYMLETVRAQFEIVEDCNEANKSLALQNLEHVFALASRDTFQALEEVQAGFPSSGGDFAAWIDEMHRRR